VLLASILAAGFSVSARGQAPAASAGAAAPSLEEVLAAIEQTFHAKKGFQTGDLISRGDVAAALDRAAQLGWQASNRSDLEKLALPDDAYLVRELRSKGGVRFMRKVSGNPQAYDRLDRLSSLSGGKQLVRDLIRGKGGHELVEYLTSSPGGANLGQMLSNGQGGSGFNRPTGRLYTLAELKKAVEASYRLQSHAAASGTSP
jgi:hypothetical protein